MSKDITFERPAVWGVLGSVTFGLKLNDLNVLLHCRFYSHIFSANDGI